MPITNASQVTRFTNSIGASIPPKLLRELELRREDPKAVEDWASPTRRCRRPNFRQARGIHFYTLNRSPATRAIVSALIAGSAWRPSFGAVR